MKNRVEQLQMDIRKARNLLEQAALFSFTPEEQAALRKALEDLSLKAAAVESEFLTIGLLGGTGVGKSTLMNALAGAGIASTSHRRPHTDRILIYRHAEAGPLQMPTLGDVPWREITHHGEAIRHLLLCDLPDFDSLLGENRRHVLRFLEDLDLLVWVTSPEKYGDGRFYAFLDLVPKAEQNFVFVLNKGDLLFEGEEIRTGYERMERVVGDFRGHIAKQGLGEPLLYLIAAEEARGAGALSPWNQFPAFRRYLFQQRDVKQITAVKTANLDVEAGRLLAALGRELSVLERFAALLDRSMKELEEGRSLWIQTGEEVIDLWIEKRIRKIMPAFQDDPACLVGPGSSIALLLRTFQRGVPEPGHAPPDSALFNPPDEITLSFRRRLTWVEDRFNHRILRQNLPPSFQEDVRETLNTAKRLENLTGRFSTLVTSHVSRPSMPPFRWFRAVQYLVYTLLLTLLLFAIGGVPAWQKVLGDPGPVNILILIVSGVQTLFSGKGLAALGSYALINIFFGLHFYRRYRRLLNRAVGKRERDLRQALSGAWEECLDFLLEDLKRFDTEIRDKTVAIASIGQADRGE
jgi:energy-coupling factor transporter ATP-binding protein EcfA2